MRSTFTGLFMPALILLFLVSCHKTIKTVSTAPPIHDSESDWLWKDIDYRDVPAQGQSLLLPSRFRCLELNTVRMQDLLASTVSSSTADKPVFSSVALPLPGGGLGVFRVTETPAMDPALQARYPRLRTYGGKGVDDPTATVRLDFMPGGFHAYLFTTGGSVLIHPLFQGDSLHYLCYFKHHTAEEKQVFEESTDTTQHRKP